jgi:hypothetical protein
MRIINRIYTEYKDYSKSSKRRILSQRDQTTVHQFKFVLQFADNKLNNKQKTSMQELNYER